MSNYEQKPGTTVIFKNDNRTNDRQPQYWGTLITPSGEVLRVSLWVKDGAKGKYFSGSVQEPYSGNSEQSAPAKSEPADNDDLPF